MTILTEYNNKLNDTSFVQNTLIGAVIPQLRDQYKKFTGEDCIIVMDDEKFIDYEALISWVADIVTTTAENALLGEYNALREEVCAGYEISPEGGDAEFVLYTIMLVEQGLHTCTELCIMAALVSNQQRAAYDMAAFYNTLNERR